VSEIHTKSTSSKTAECDPIVLRAEETVRLVFLPMMVDNRKAPRECVKGTFVYQRKKKNNEWESITGQSLASLKSGEGYQLALHCDELYTLMRGVGPIYRLHGQEGIPRGKNRFVRVEAGLAPFLELGRAELAGFLETHSENAAAVLLKLIGWLANSEQGISDLAKMNAAELPSLTALLGLAAIKNAVAYWVANQTNEDEEFWQRALAERAYVLSQAYSYPVVILKSKAYLGGKAFDNTGGKVADFLLAAESTSAALIVEIKTPRTKLLGQRYRGVFPFSTDLSGAIAQALSYQQTLGLNFVALKDKSPHKVVMGETRCLVIAGNTTSEFTSNEMKECFELQRERLQGVTVIGYDELFSKIQKLVALLEARTSTE
jgi:Domain of unknown function (DUF4263)